MKNTASEAAPPSPRQNISAAGATTAERPWSARVGDELNKAFSRDNEQLYPALWIGGLLLALMYAYGNMLIDLTGYWTDDQYSHGWIIPIFSMVVLWLWRKPIGFVSDGERWAGAALVCLALGLRMYFAFRYWNTPGMATFPFAILGVFLMVGGVQMLKWSVAPILFLFFMFPLPMMLENGILKPLNTVAVTASTYTLQTLGVECYRQKNVIYIDQLDEPLAVIDQCSGLRMVTIFSAMAVGCVMLIPMDWWERVVIVAFAIPIAVFVNLTRIVVTGLLYLAAANNSDWITKDMAHSVFHDLAGWLMMPAAMGLMLLLHYVLSRLVIDDEPTVHAPIRSAAPPRVGSLVGK